MRKIAFLLAVLLLVSFTSCAKQEADENGEQTSQTQASTTTAKGTTTTKETTKELKNPFEKHLEISYLVRHTPLYDSVRWDQLELEEKFNITLDVWTIDSYDSEQAALMAASGEWADTGFVNAYDPVRAYREGLTRSITKEDIRLGLPEYYAYVDSNPIGFKVNKIQDTDDEYYGVSMVSAQNNYWYNVNCFRLDWLENVGYGINDLTEVIFSGDDLKDKASGSMYLSNHIFTFDEYEKILEAFTEDDPDGNGIDDTFGTIWPLLGPSYGSHWTDINMAMFGISSAYTEFLFYDEATSNYLPSYAFPGWRDFLAFTSDMLQKGYIRYVVDVANGDFVGNFYGNLATGKFGYFPLDALASANPSSGVVEQRIPLVILEQNPDARMVVVPAISGPYGTKGNRRYVHLPFRDGSYGTWTFGHACDDEKLERALALLRYTHFDEVGYTRYAYGIEGIHFEWDGEPYNSAVVKKPNDKVPDNYKNSARQDIFASDRFLFNFKQFSLVSEWFVQLCDFQVENRWFIDYALEPDKLISRLYMGDELYEEYVDLRDEVNSEIMVVANDFRDKAFNGELADINAEWSTYVDMLYSAGLEKYIEIFNSEQFEKYIIDKEGLYK